MTLTPSQLVGDNSSNSFNYFKMIKIGILGAAGYTNL